MLDHEEYTSLLVIYGPHTARELPKLHLPDPTWKLYIFVKRWLGAIES